MNPYIAGIVASDGHVGSNSWLISQSYKSLDILRKVQKFMKKGRLRLLNTSGRYSNKPSYNLVFNKSKKNNPFKIWGIPEGNKTYTLKFPEGNCEEDVWLYLRGFFEGDGTLYLDRVYPRVEIISNRGWCDFCKKFLELNNVRCYIHSDKRHPGIANVIIRRVNSVHNFFDKIYENAVPLFMDRKYYRWQELKEEYPRIKERKIRRKVSRTDKEKIENMLISGLRPFEIQQSLNFPESAILRIYSEKFGGRKALMQKKEEKIRKFLKEGKTPKEIKEKGFNYPLISKMFNQLWPDISCKKKNKISLELKEKAINLLKLGMKPKDVSRETGIAYSTLCMIDRKDLGGQKARVEKKKILAEALLKQGLSGYVIINKYKINCHIIKSVKEELCMK